MVSCPVPGTLDSLVEYAKSVGLNQLSENAALRAYMVLNSTLQEGEEPRVPTSEEFDEIMEHFGVFVNSPNRNVVMTDRFHGFEDGMSAIPYFKELIHPTPFDAESVETVKVASTLTALADKLSSNLGVPYEFITKERAIELTAGVNQWSGQPAFFFSNTVYIIPELASEKSVFHEFAHPVIRAIKMANPELYNKLVEEFNSLVEAEDILNKAKEAYPGVDPSDPIIMEEALVISLTKAADEKSTSAFNQFIKNLMFAIRQLLRKVFGKDNKVTIEKLKPDTTLSELADMLMIQPLDIDLESITREDLAAFATDTEDYIKAMTDFSDDAIIAGINDLYERVNTWSATIERNEDYAAMREILKDFFQKSDLSELYKNLAPYQTVDGFTANQFSKIRSELQFSKDRVMAFTNNLLRMKAMSQRINKAVKEIAKDPNDPENIGKIYYINNIIADFNEYIEYLGKVIREDNIPNDNPVIELIKNISFQIESIKVETGKVYKEGVSKILSEELSPMGKNITDKYNSLSADFAKRGAPKSLVDKLNKDYWGLEGTELSNFLRYKAVVESGGRLSSKEDQAYEILKRKSFVEGSYLTPEKIDYLMTGQLKDASGINSFLEPYMYNQDLVVSGFALWVKNKMTDVFTTAQERANSFLNDVKPLLDAAGYNQADPAAFGQKVTFLDKKAGRDENGNFISKEVHTYLMPFQDWQLVISQMDYDIQMAKADAEKSGDSKEVLRLQTEKQKFMNEFFHKPFTDEYYNRFEIFNKGDDDVIGPRAQELRSEIMARIQNTQSILGNSTAIEANDIVDQELNLLWREYRQLHSNYDERGQLKNTEGLAIAERLREFRDANKNLYEDSLIPGQFEASLAAYENELVEVKKLLRGSRQFKKMRQIWLDNNTRIKVKQKFYDDRQILLDELEAILAKVPKDVKVGANVAEMQKQIIMLMNPYRDVDNQPEATAMTANNIEEIRNIQENIELAKKDLAKTSGLTENEHDRVTDYFNRKKDGERLSAAEQTDLDELLDKKKANRLSKTDLQRVYEIFSDLSELQSSRPTEYYLDVLTHYTSFLTDTSPLQDVLASTEINAENADKILTMEFYQKVASLNPQFKKWYEDNHIFKQVVDKTGKKVVKIERVKAWSIIRPNSPEYYEAHEFTNSEGKKEIIPTVPNLNYYVKNVKDEYVTKQVTMLEALEMGDPTLANVMFRSNDPRKAKFLPRLNAPDKRFINQKFFDVKNNDPALYKALLAMSKWHLKFQEGSPYSSRLFMEIPRFRKHGYEITREALRGGENPIAKWRKNLMKLLRNSFGNSKDPYDQGLNFEDQLLGMRTELYNEDDSQGIPIQGLANLDANEVSLDLTFGMLKYMISSEKQRALVKMNPVARALQSVVNDPDFADNQIKRTSKVMMGANNLMNFASEKVKTGKPKSPSIRAKAINNFIEREFEGRLSKGVLGNDKETQWVTKAATAMIKMSAFGYFALDIGSAVKNGLNARLQSISEAAGGRYYNFLNYSKGSAWASKMSAEMSFQVYKFGPKSLSQQMVQIFDAFQGEAEEKIPEIGSRSFTKDALGGLSWMTSFRRWTEKNSALSNFGAMMYHQTIPRTVNGKTEYISYMDAWEMGPNDQIKLKDGIDPEWGIGGVNFKQFKNKVQGVINNLNGAHAKFDYAEADRYLAYRFVTTMKRFFLRMMMSRYQFRGRIWDPKYRYDANVGDTVMGYHIESLRYVIRGLRSAGKTVPFMTPSEKIALLKTLMDGVMLYAFTLAISTVFGFDDGDEDKYLKLREKSGPLPIFGVSEDENEFKLGGWISNQLLYLSLQTENELASITPFTSAGRKSYVEMLDFSSLAMTKTIKNYIKVFSALDDKLDGEDKAYYDQKVGPYIWMQGGSAEEGGLEGDKATAAALKSIGITGKSIDPAMAITNLVKTQNWR